MKSEPKLTVSPLYISSLLIGNGSTLMGNSFEAKKKIEEFKLKHSKNAIIEVDEDNFVDQRKKYHAIFSDKRLTNVSNDEMMRTESFKESVKESELCKETKK
jgi:hypothetical protein